MTRPRFSHGNSTAGTNSSRGRISKGGLPRQRVSKQSRSTAGIPYKPLEYSRTEILWFPKDEQWDPLRLVKGIKKIYLGEDFNITEYTRPLLNTLNLG